MTWTKACLVTDTVEATPHGVVVAGMAVCVVRLEGEVYALHDQCTHAAVPLSEGEVEDGSVECWLHGSRFDLRTGAVLNPPATRPVAVYPTRVSVGRIEVDLPTRQTDQT